MSKDNCSICSKELEMGTYIDTNYHLSWYHSQQPEKKDLKTLCENCYQDKEQWYLDNYEHIWKETDKEGVEFIKGSTKDCYTEKKDQNGQVLKQRDCQHCQPWKYDEDIPKPISKTCSVCGKDISRQEMTYSSESSNEGKKYYCSSECMIKQHNPPKNSESNSKNEKMSTEIKVFFGILVAFSLFVIGIALGKIWQKNKNKK